MEEKKNKGARYWDLYNAGKDVTRNWNLDQWLGMFREVYGGRIHLMTLESIGFHFLEEAGEESQSVRKLLQLEGVITQNVNGVDENFLKKLTTIEGLVDEYCHGKIPRSAEGKPALDLYSRESKHIKARVIDAKMDFVIELADTFSWFCSVLIKLQEVLENSKIWSDEFEIEKVLQREYGRKGKPLRCPRCKGIPCKCVFFSKGEMTSIAPPRNSADRQHASFGGRESHGLGRRVRR
jgi:hypothetical protein